MRGRHGADQDRAIVEQPVGPAEFEEGEGQDQHQAEYLGLEGFARRSLAERQVGQNLEHAVGGAEQGKAAAERDQGRRGKEGGALLQAAHDGGIDNAYLALGHIAHPGLALGIHRGRQRDAADQLAVGGERVQHPDDQKEGQSRQICQ